MNVYQSYGPPVLTLPALNRLAALPPELVERLLLWENVYTILCVARTCSRLYYSVVRNDRLWRRLYWDQYGDTDEEMKGVNCDGGENNENQIDTAGRNSARPAGNHASWFAAYCARARLVCNWRGGLHHIYHMRPQIVDSGVTLPNRLRVLVANARWAFVAGSSPTQMFLLEIPISSSQISNGSVRPTAYPLSWLLPTESQRSDLPLNRLAAPDMAFIASDYVVVRTPTLKDRLDVPCTILAWRLSDRKLTRRLLFSRRDASLLQLTDRWLMYRWFNDHLQEEVDFLCDISLNDIDGTNPSLGQLRVERPAPILTPNATEDGNGYVGGIIQQDEDENDDHPAGNYGGAQPRIMYLAPEVGHLHRLAAGWPLVYRCAAHAGKELRWSLLELDSSDSRTTRSGQLQFYKSEVYLKPSMRIADDRVLLTGALRDVTTGYFRTWLAVHQLPVMPGDEDKLLFERDYQRSIRPDACALVRGCREQADMLAWIQLGELLVVDLTDGSIRYHFHHDMPSIGQFMPVVGPFYMLVDDRWRLLLDTTSGWWHLFTGDDPYMGFELAGPERLITLQRGRLRVRDFSSSPKTPITSKPYLHLLRRAADRLRGHKD